MPLLPHLTRRYPFLTPRSALLKRLPTVPADVSPFRGRYGTIAGLHAGREHVAASLYWFGDFDPWVGRLLMRLATPGSVALDVGANIGATVLPLARAVGLTGRVFAFEPQPVNARLCRATIEANGLSMRVELHAVALSDRVGTLTLGMGGDQPCMARVVDAGEPGAVAVPMTTLDAWLDGRPDIDRVSVCKIDVEGHEAGVLAGAARTLAAGRIDALVFECHGAGSAEAEALLTMVRGAGFDVYRIFKSALRVRLAPLGQVESGTPTEDFVAMRQGWFWAEMQAARYGLDRYRSS